MSDSNPLFDLLPAIHRIRDAEQGGPLRALLDVIADEAAVLEEGLAQAYDDQFIETCADWVVPYIGDLIGYRSLHHNVPSLGSPRAEVAHTIAYRRRKGTMAMLEQLGRDVTGWPCKAVEFFQLLQTTQYLNHVRPHNALTPDLRDWSRLERIDSAFDRQAHAVDTRSIRSGEGRHNIPNIGLYLWRIAAYRLSASPAVAVDAQRFRFHPAGIDAALWQRPQSEPGITHLAEPPNVPEPITRRRMWEDPGAFYGDGLSIEIEGVPLEDIRVCDLSDHDGGWAHTPPAAGEVAVDPALGRLAFGTAPEEPPRVTFHGGAVMDLGGGEYERAASFDLPTEPVDEVNTPDSLQDALANRTSGQAVQIQDNGRYEETLSLAVEPGEQVELRGLNGRRPTLVLGGDFEISGGDEAAEVSLNGLLIMGGTLRITGTLRRLRLRHCTLVPGLSLNPDATPQHPDTPGLVIEQGGVTVEIAHCILGGIRCHDLSRVEASDSVIDACSASGVAFAGLPEPAPDALPPAGGVLRLEESTVVGKLHTQQLELVSNSILFAELAEGDVWPAPVLSERKQIGCMRFSYVPWQARTPRRYRCQPDLEIATRIDAAARTAEAEGMPFGEPQRAAVRNAVRTWLKPAFTSLRYGHLGYTQLRNRCPSQIRAGADDEAGMGATHDLYEPQRLANLRIRLGEYLRFGLEAGTFTAS